MFICNNLQGDMLKANNTYNITAVGRCAGATTGLLMVAAKELLLNREDVTYLTISYKEARRVLDQFVSLFEDNVHKVVIPDMTIYMNNGTTIKFGIEGTYIGKCKTVLIDKVDDFSVPYIRQLLLPTNRTYHITTQPYYCGNGLKEWDGNLVNVDAESVFKIKSLQQLNYHKFQPDEYINGVNIITGYGYKGNPYLDEIINRYKDTLEDKLMSGFWVGYQD